MDDLNDLYFFSLVIKHQGFTAAARATGIEKTRLSRRVASLEQHLGIRLLERSTRKLTLTQAGESFYVRAMAAIESVREAYDSVEALKTEPSGTVRVSCPVVLAQSYLAPILPGYMALHPKVALFIEATDHAVNMQEDRFDVSLQVNVPASENMDFVALHLGSARRLLVAQPALLDRLSRPERPSGLAGMPCMCRITDMKDGRANWILSHEISAETQTIDLAVKLMTSDMRVQLEAALQGIGVALLPEPLVSDALKDKQLERVLPQWSAGHNDIQLVYRSPRGMLPSVRSLIDYLIAHFPDEIRRRGVQDPSP